MICVCFLPIALESEMSGFYRGCLGAAVFFTPGFSVLIACPSDILFLMVFGCLCSGD